MHLCAPCTCCHLERKISLLQRAPTVQHKTGILQLLEAVNEPQEIELIHCQGDSDIIKGNNLADKAAKIAQMPTPLSRQLHTRCPTSQLHTQLHLRLLGQNRPHSAHWDG